MHEQDARVTIRAVGPEQDAQGTMVVLKNKKAKNTRAGCSGYYEQDACVTI